VVCYAWVMQTHDLPSTFIVDELTRLAAVDKPSLLEFREMLAEAERRGLPHLMGLSSRWRFLTAGLGLSERAARRRVVALRLIDRFPVIEAYLLARRINLSTLCVLKHVLTEDNVVGVLDRVSGGTEQDARALVASMAASVAPVAAPGAASAGAASAGGG